MADEELKALLGEEPEPTPPAAEEPKAPAPEENQEAKAKAEQLANLNKAIEEAQSQLKKVRKDKQKAKAEPDDEDLPKIDMEDPSAKAWDRRIQSYAAPMQAEFEKEKDEIRQFALKEFLQDRPSLSKNPEKLKAVMETYDRIKTSSERTREGVILDLEKAYAAEHHEELISAARQSRVDTARNDAIFSDIAVSRGATTYANPKESAPNLSEDDKLVLAKWGMSPTEWVEAKKKFG